MVKMKMLAFMLCLPFSFLFPACGMAGKKFLDEPNFKGDKYE